MSRRRRKRQRARTRRNRVKSAPQRGLGQEAQKPRKGAPSEASDSNGGSGPKVPEYGWVNVEHRDADGNLTLPREWIQSTYPRRYRQIPPDTEIKVLVLPGYKPKPLMMVERKIYEIHRLFVRGWRRSGQVTAEVEGWRAHESDWFDAMQGAKLQISDPGLPGQHNEDSDYVISSSSFNRKIVNQLDEKGGKTEVRLCEGTLNIVETWKSAWRRQRAEVLNLGVKLLFLPLFAALGAGLTLLWVGRPVDSSGNDLNGSEISVQAEDQRTDSLPRIEQPDEAIDGPSQEVPLPESEGEGTPEPNDSVPEAISSSEGSSLQTARPDALVPSSGPP